MTQLDKLRASLRYSSGADRRTIRALIAEIEAERTHEAVTAGRERHPPPPWAGAKPETAPAVAGAARSCAECGGTLQRQPNERPSVFARRRYCSRACGLNGTWRGRKNQQPHEIRTAAQGPAAAPRRRAGANSRRPAVDVAPGKRAPEKVRAGGKDCNAPMPSSQGGHIAGAAANLAPRINPNPSPLLCARPGCDRLIGRSPRPYCWRCYRDLGPARRQAATLTEPAPGAAAPEPRQAPPGRPHFALIYDTSIVIRPDRPAPNPRWLMFQDDLSAIHDHGSPSSLPRPDDIRGSAIASSAVRAIEA